MNSSRPSYAFVRTPSAHSWIYSYVSACALSISTLRPLSVHSRSPQLSLHVCVLQRARAYSYTTPHSHALTCQIRKRALLFPKLFASTSKATISPTTTDTDNRIHTDVTTSDIVIAVHLGFGITIITLFFFF